MPIPPIPPEQRSFKGEDARDRLRSAEPGRRDSLQGVEPDADGGVDEKAWDSGNIRQNLTPRRSVQER